MFPRCASQYRSFCENSAPWSFQTDSRKNGYVLEQLFSLLIVHTTPEHEELKEIRRKREEAGLSLRDVADETGVSASTLSRIENGTGKPDADNIARMGDLQASWFKDTEGNILCVANM